MDEKPDRPFNSRIERIILVGLDGEPESIKSASGESLVFVTRKSDQEFIVTIKNPNMAIGSAFELTVGMSM